MKIIFPDWALENIAHNGLFQCGVCMNQHDIEARGDIPNLIIGFEHAHVSECLLSKYNGTWEELEVEIGEVARLLLHDLQATKPPPEPSDITPVPRLESLDRRLEASGKGWLKEWLTNKVDPCMPKTDNHFPLGPAHQDPS